MFKKLLPIFTALALVFSLTPAAQAAGSLTQTDKDGVANYVESQNLELVKVTDSLTVALWPERGDSGYVYKSAVVSGEGLLGQAIEFGASSDLDMYSNMKFAVSPSGLLTVVYKYSRDDGNDTTSPSLRVVFTDDGVHWSAPIMAVPIESTNSRCDMMMDFGCGYEAKSLIYDSLGHLVLLATLSREREEASMIATTSVDGVMWSNPTTLQTGQFAMGWSERFGNDCINLTSTSVGALATWCLYNAVNGSQQLWSARMPDSNHPFWLSPVNDANSDAGTWVKQVKLFKKSNGDVVRTFWQENGTSPVLKLLTWSSVTRTWSAPSIVYTAPSAWIQTWAHAYQGMLNALAWVETSNGSDDVIRALVFKDGVAGPVSTLRAAVGDGTGNTGLFALSVSSDQTVSAAIWNYSIRQAFLLEKSPGADAVSTSIPLDLNYNYQAALAEDSKGNLTMISHWVADQGPAQTLVTYQKARASAPMPAGSLKVAGKPKVKVKLTASTVSFTSISGASAAAYQWYSCTKAVKKAPTTAPKTCKVIKGATKAQYLATKADVKKYLMVATSSSNVVGKTSVFSASTAVVK